MANKHTLCILAALLLFTVVSSLKVRGNQLVDDSGTVVILQGVSHSGTEYMCIGGYGIFDGPVNSSAIAYMKAWNINAVRIPLNEDCWLGINGVLPAYGGFSYQAAISMYVDRLWEQNIYSILDLHWTAAGGTKATGQQPMPDMNHAPSMWNSVAATFKNRSHVVFDVFNEPYPDTVSQGNATEAWTCWRDGGTCTGISFQVAGMQTLINSIRNAGSTNVLILGGLRWSNDLSQWLTFRPTDPLNNYAASTHIYNFNACITPQCWDLTLQPILNAGIPVVIGEHGENDCEGWFMELVATWYKTSGASHLAWTWNTWDCKNGPALITNFDGTCTNSYGCTVKQIFLK